MTMIAYKCRCMKAEQELPVPDRIGDLVDWTEMVITCVSVDHRARNPLCVLREMQTLKIPVSQTTGMVGSPETKQ